MFNTHKQVSMGQIWKLLEDSNNGSRLGVFFIEHKDDHHTIFLIYVSRKLKMSLLTLDNESNITYNLLVKVK